MPDPARSTPEPTTCTKCRGTDFYQNNPKKCRACNRAQCKAWYHKKKTSREWVTTERRRNRVRDRRRWRDNPRYREAQRSYNRGRRRQQSAVKLKAKEQVRVAVSAGKLNPSQNCERCGHDFSDSRREAHHADYSKPLDVEWLCQNCHAKHHRKVA